MIASISWGHGLCARELINATIAAAASETDSAVVSGAVALAIGVLLWLRLGRVRVDGTSTARSGEWRLYDRSCGSISRLPNARTVAIRSASDRAMGSAALCAC